ncbi:MAG: iron-sulfur cluster assembly scaffold protein [Pseudomonadota bacterium]
MARDSDLIKLYSKRILALAADMPLTEPLAAPDVVVKRRAPLCGSTVTVSLNLEDGRIAGYSQNVKACALGQASAALMARYVIGRTRAEIEAGRDALAAMLAGTGDGPGAPWEDYDVLTPARDYRNRHASIMLAFEATAQAMAEAAASACA